MSEYALTAIALAPDRATTLSLNGNDLAQALLAARQRVSPQPRIAAIAPGGQAPGDRDLADAPVPAIGVFLEGGDIERRRDPPREWLDALASALPADWAPAVLPWMYVQDVFEITTGLRLRMLEVLAREQQAKLAELVRRASAGDRRAAAALAEEVVRTLSLRVSGMNIDVQMAANALATQALAQVDRPGLLRGRWVDTIGASLPHAPWALALPEPSPAARAGVELPQEVCGYRGSGPRKGPWEVR